MDSSAPLAAFLLSPDRGRAQTGFRGDMVVLDADPARDAPNLAKVAYTFRGGRIIYPRAAPKQE